MSTLKYVERLQRMDQLIRMKATGTSVMFAERMGISRSVLMETIKDLKDMGCEIAYCRIRQSYYYAKKGKLHIGFLADESSRIKGGGKFSQNSVSPIISDNYFLDLPCIDY